MKKLIKKISILTLLAIPAVTLASCGFEEGDPFEKKVIDTSGIIFNDTIVKYTSSNIEYNIVPMITINNENVQLTADKLTGVTGISISYYNSNNEKVVISSTGTYKCVLSFDVNENLYETVEDMVVTFGVYNDVDLSGLTISNGTASLDDNSIDKSKVVVAKINNNEITELPQGVSRIYYTYEGTNTTEYALSEAVPTKAGEYIVKPVFEYSDGYYEFDAADADKSAKLILTNDADMSNFEFNDVVGKVGENVTFTAIGIPSGFDVTYKINGVTTTSSFLNKSLAGTYKITASFNCNNNLITPIEDKSINVFLYDDDNVLDPTIFEYDGSEDVTASSMNIGNFTLNGTKFFYNTAAKTATDNTIFEKNKRYIKLEKNESISVNLESGKSKIVIYLSTASTSMTANNSILKVNSNDVLIEDTLYGSKGNIVRIEIDDLDSGVYNLTSPNGTFKVWKISIE